MLQIVLRVCLPIMIAAAGLAYVVAQHFSTPVLGCDPLTALSMVVSHFTPAVLRMLGVILSCCVFGALACGRVERARRMSLRMMLDHDVSLAHARRFLFLRVCQASLIAVWGPFLVNAVLGQPITFHFCPDSFDVRMHCPGD